MNIAFACTAEGFGHAARTVALAGELGHRHRIHVFAPPPAHRFISEHLPEVSVRSIPFFALRKEGPRISYLGTIVDNAGLMARFQPEVHRVAGMLEALDIEAVVSDYDPFCAHAAASMGIPVLQINHPAVVLRDTSSHPAAVAARTLAPFLMGPHDEQMICSFYRGDVGPIIRRDLVNAPRSKGDYLLVYAKDSYRDLVVDALRQVGIDRYQLFPDPGRDYVEAFAGCRAVISSAGHQIISEAIVLGKPILVLPQAGQYEQELNANMLERSGRGTWAREDSFHIDLRRFLVELGSYPRPRDSSVSFSFEDHREAVASRIEQFCLAGEKRSPALTLSPV